MNQGDQIDLELAVCPYCGMLTDASGEFLACCGEEVPYGVPMTTVQIVGRVKEIRNPKTQAS